MRGLQSQRQATAGSMGRVSVRVAECDAVFKARVDAWRGLGVAPKSDEIKKRKDAMDKIALK
jgi:hypothetical protein